MSGKPCNYCGLEYTEGATHCLGCGADLLASAETSEALVDSEASAWILKTFRWALEQFGANYFYDDTVLVVPSGDCFPDQSADPNIQAQLLFDRVQAYAGLQQWPCKLVAQEPDINPVLDQLIVIENPPTGPHGTFSMTDADPPEIEITYNPATVGQPQLLIATLAHELAHYLGHTARELPPGGEKNWEYATDLLAVFMGFGLFLANSAVEFSQFSDGMRQGWYARGSGYLSEFELVYCLAIFCVLKGIEREQVRQHLKESLMPVYDEAIKDLEGKQDALEELKRSKFTP